MLHQKMTIVETKKEVDVKRLSGEWTVLYAVMDSGLGVFKQTFDVTPEGDLMYTYVTFKQGPFRRVGDPLGGHFQKHFGLICFCFPPAETHDIYILETDYDRYLVFAWVVSSRPHVYISGRTAEVFQDKELMERLKALVSRKFPNINLYPRIAE